MIDLGAVGDLAFVAAAYSVILGGIGLYAAILGRRLRRARQAASIPPSGQQQLPEPPADRPA